MAKVTLNTDGDIKIITVISEGLEIIHYQDNEGIIKISMS